MLGAAVAVAGDDLSTTGFATDLFFLAAWALNASRLTARRVTNKKCKRNEFFITFRVFDSEFCRKADASPPKFASTFIAFVG